MNERFAAAVAGLTVLAASAHAQILAQSTFDTDDEGWRYLDTEFADDLLVPDHFASGGNPDGFVQGDDAGNGAWYWVAPSKFLGDLSGAIGGTLSFDQFTLGNGELSEGVQDILIADPAGSTILSLNTPGTPTEAWTSTSVSLDLSESWFNEGEQRAATEAEFTTIMSDLGHLWILGEYRRGADTGGLDNVIITPAPATAGVLVLASLVVARRRR